MDHLPGGRRDLRLAIVAHLAVALAIAAVGCSPASSTGGSPSATPGAPIGQAEAVARVLAQDPSFSGIGPLDPNMIGQSAWYEVMPGTVGWRVMITRGWGDCQAGCISRHTWTYEVDGTGAVRLVEEGGDPLPGGADGDGAGGVPASPPVSIPPDGGPWIVGRAQAGPTCPVVQNPPDPSCADRPVAGAVVVVRDVAGNEVARVTTAGDGTFLVAVPGGGSWAVEPQPVEGLLGTPPAIIVQLGDDPRGWASVILPYDTGIR